ncbi:MAG TPA: mononuclear molybdenum enzyme YedY, partial [Chloroflexi bacterium]|nr:mononuclear molybdenum enzyme YedY [Chloroflexota bacterium]
MKIRSSEITSEYTYLSRRKFITSTTKLMLGTLLVSSCSDSDITTNTQSQIDNVSNNIDSLPDKLTTYESITNYNNFYEFTTDKERVSILSQDLVISPWTIRVGGLVKNPRTFAVDDLIKIFDQEERIYRLRCVEGWSMVIPWLGFPLN